MNYNFAQRDLHIPEYLQVVNYQNLNQKGHLN